MGNGSQLGDISAEFPTVTQEELGTADLCKNSEEYVFWANFILLLQNFFFAIKVLKMISAHNLCFRWCLSSLKSKNCYHPLWNLPGILFITVKELEQAAKVLALVLWDGHLCSASKYLPSVKHVPGSPEIVTKAQIFSKPTLPTFKKNLFSFLKCIDLWVQCNGSFG